METGADWPRNIDPGQGADRALYAAKADGRHAISVA
jgi:hypothetical protein